jgi:hypothetical protein
MGLPGLQSERGVPDPVHVGRHRRAEACDGDRGRSGSQRARGEEGLQLLPGQRRRVVGAAVPRLRPHVPATHRRGRRDMRARLPRGVPPATAPLARARRGLQGHVHPRPVVPAAVGSQTRILGLQAWGEDAAAAAPRAREPAEPDPRQRADIQVVGGRIRGTLCP